MLINEIITETMDSLLAQDSGDSLHQISYWDGRMKVYFDYGDDLWKTSLHIYFKVDDKVNLTGGGNAFKILSTFNNSVKTNLPKVISKSTRRIYIQTAAGEPSRVKFARSRTIPMVTDTLNRMDGGWKFTGEKAFGDVVEFYWSR